MKGRLKKAGALLAILTMFIYIFTLSASAESSSAGSLGEVEELIPEWAKGDSEELTSALGPDALIYEIYSAFKGSLGPALSFFSVAFGLSLCLLCLGSFEGELMKKAGEGASVIVGTLLFALLSPILKEASAALGSMTEFFSTLGGVMSAITLAGGGAGTAAVQAGAVGFTLSLTSGLGGNFLISLALTVFSVGLLSAFGSSAVSSLSKFIHSVFTWGVGAVSAVLGASLSLQTLVSAASDSVAIRTAKYAVSGMLPIVSGTVTGALSTLVSGLSYVKSVVGASAIFIILSAALSPLFLLLLYKFSLSLCAGFLETSGLSGAVRVYASLRRGLDCVIAVYTLMTVIYIFQMVVFMKCGVALS